MKIRALLFLFYAAASGVHAAPWIASPEVIAGQRDSREIRGVVFEDLDGDLQRTQEGAGEDSRRGARHADPFAIKRQASVGRWAIRSRSGEERNQGWEGGRGATANTGAPQPSGWADRSVHLWQARLPADLSEGVHTLRLTSTDRNGRSWADVVTFEVRAAHPPPRHRREVWR